MTEEQKKWFEELSKRRSKSATTLLSDFAISNIWNSVVEKYSDQAHFIYELLQNANDVKATKSAFDLTANGLYFKHNGKKHFWVSNPNSEKEDQKNNRLGDINSITAVAQSNKKDESTIGKFGVGFKAVFQYTKTPHIYDPNFQFKICNYIVPEKLENDLKDREKGETVFYFPFDKEETKETAYSDILEKLQSLVYPTLFLSSLEEVKWETDGKQLGEYKKEKIWQKQTEDKIRQEQPEKFFYEKLELYKTINQIQTKEYLLLFTRIENIHKHAYSVGYFIDDNDKLKQKQKLPAFCFFPTKETTNLNFIIHAPFQLTDSRENIKRFESHNTKMIFHNTIMISHNRGMIQLLAVLAADSLWILRSLSLIKDDIFNIIPYKKPEESDLFSPFFSRIKFKFQTQELLPAKDGTFARKENAYWAVSPDLTDLFNHKQLSILVGKENAKWVFSSISRTDDKDIRDYIDGGFRDKRESYLIKASVDIENKIANLITAEFINKQPIVWLHKFYEYLSERKSYFDNFKNKPIFLNSEGQAVPAFERIQNRWELILFLPTVNSSPYETIHIKLLSNQRTKEFIENFGIREPSFENIIYNHIIPLYKDNGTDEIETHRHFEWFFSHWKKEGRPADFFKQIEDIDFVSYKTEEEETTYRGKGCDIYYPSKDLKNYFEFKPDTKFLDLKDYSFMKVEDTQELKEFFLGLGVRELPKIITTTTENPENQTIIRENNLDYGINIHNRRNDFVTRITDKSLDGLEEILSNIEKEEDRDKSFFLWKFIPKLSHHHSKAIFQYAVSTYRVDKKEFPSDFIRKLKTKKWLLSKSKKFVSPNEITPNELAEGYDRNSTLESLLGFKPTEILTEEERIARMFESEEQAQLARKLLDKHNEGKTGDTGKKSPSNVDSGNTNDGFEQHPKMIFETTIKNLEVLGNGFKKETIKNVGKSEAKTVIKFEEDEEFAKGIEDLKKQLEIKKSRVDLADNMNKCPKYSYDWFLAYLELLTTYGEKQSTPIRKSICFQEIKPYKTDNKYFLLCGASTYISPEIEDANDFKVRLVFGNGEKKEITVEGVSKKGQDLLIYCSGSMPVDILSRLSNIFKVEINFTPIIDLLDRLYQKFKNIEYIDNWQEINENMPPLNYIYGPPGTGKTTTLCKEIEENLNNNYMAKILVLTPTNKAADVVNKS